MERGAVRFTGPQDLAGRLLQVNDPVDGRPPYEEIYLPALASGLFTEDALLSCGSLRVLRRH